MTSLELTTQRRSFDPERLVRTSLRSAPSYIPATIPAATPARVIKLDMNESPYGPSPKARTALATFADTNRYPDFEQLALREAIGAYVNRPADQVICGAGLDDVLNTFMHAVIEPGDEVIISEPTFGVYQALISLYDGKTIDVPLTRNFELDAFRVLSSITDRTKFVIVCTPNNPTGNALDRGAIEQIVAEAPCMVVIDEAYAEFAGTSYLDQMDRHPNVAIFRTMSKFAGLAGLRVGYGVFPAALMPFLAPVTPAFHNVSMASRVAAIASLEDLEHLHAVVAGIIADRGQLAAALGALPGVLPLSSSTNFVLVRLPVDDAGPLVAELARRGVFVRHFARPELGLRDCLRVTVGLPEENQVFVEELSDILASQRGIS
ncbi:histidinol-phosphate transaminase [soil metagenome]